MYIYNDTLLARAPLSYYLVFRLVFRLVSNFIFITVQFIDVVKAASTARHFVPLWQRARATVIMIPVLTLVCLLALRINTVVS